MPTRVRTAVLLAAVGLTLTACSTVHPGDAAVVDGQSISMKTLDRTAEAYCTLSARTAQQQGGAAPDNADMRRQAVTSLVSLVVARRLASEKGISPKPASYELTSDQQDQIAKAFPTADAAEIGKAIEQSQEISQIAVALGSRSAGQTPTADNQAQLAQAGQAEITKAFKANEVKFAPRFGIKAGQSDPTTGSLSVAQADTGKASGAELPAAQRCS
jgi:hypothetical protein